LKPDPRKAYGSIPHLIGSQANGDKFVSIGQHNIATKKPRDNHDKIIVQEKPDGSMCAILRKYDHLIPIGRNGHFCEDSPHLQHRIFHQWVMQHYEKFDFLKDGERLCGEWLIQAHGTKYKIISPYIVFDIMKGDYRLPYDKFVERLPKDFVMPYLLHQGGPCSIEEAMLKLGDLGYHGGLEQVEGAVWRVERKGEVDFLTKFLRRSPETIGRYLGDKEIWNVDIKKFRKGLPWKINNE